VLAQLLHKLPVTSQAKTLKLLTLARLLVHGVRITRREAWLSSFISDLVSCLTSPDLAPASLFILCSLCHDNYIVTKLVISLLPDPSLASLLSTQSPSPSEQMLAEILLHSFTTLQLSPKPPSQDKVHSYLPKLMDVFCSSYSNDDVPMMSILNSFLSKLSSDSIFRDILAQQDCLTHLQQLLVVADFSDGFCQSSARLLFTFVSSLLSLYSCDPVTKFDLCLKLVLARLDSKPSGNLQTGLSLLTGLFSQLDVTSLSDAVSRSLKFQVDQLLPSLLGVFVDLGKASSSGSASKLSKTSKSSGKGDLDRDSLQSCLALLALLQAIANVDLHNWNKAVASGVKSSKMMLTFKTISEQIKDPGDRALVTVEMMTLSSLLSEADSGWRTAHAELSGDRERLHCVMELVRREKMEAGTLKKALRLLNSIETSFDILDEEPVERESVKPTIQAVAEASAQDMCNIENMLESVENAVANMELDEVMTDVLELADVRRGQERRQISHLMEALAAADSRLSHQNLALLEREDQVRRLERTVSGLVSRLTGSREEVKDMRSQHGDLSREADITRDKLSRELEDAKGQVDSLSGDKEALTEKVVKYKGQVVSLSQDLEQYRDNQEQLEKRLKQEIKGREEVTVTLGKREDKLKKKDRQLEDEQGNRERLEKEVEDLKKQCSSLKTLTERQEQVLSKKEKQIQEQNENIKDLKSVQDAIFNLSKNRNGSTSGAG